MTSGNIGTAQTFATLGSFLSQANTDDVGTIAVAEDVQTTNVTVTVRVTITATDAVKQNAATYVSLSSKARMSGRLYSAVAGPTYEKFGILRSGTASLVDSAATYRRMVIQASSNLIQAFAGGAGGTVTIDNCAMWTTGSDPIAYNDQAGITINVYQASGLSESTGGGFVSAGGAVNAYGVVMQGSGTHFSGCGGDYNVGDSSAPGPHSIKSVSGVFTNTSAGSEDLTLLCALAIVDETGFPGDCTTDLLGNTRTSPWGHAGCVEWVNPNSTATLLTHTVDTPGSNGGSTSNIDARQASLLIFGIGHGQSTAQATSDSKSNAWSSSIFATSGGRGAQLNFVSNAVLTSSAQNASETGGSSYPTEMFSAWNGISTHTPLDQQNSAVTASGTSLSPGSVTPSEGNELVISVIAFNNPPQSGLTIDSGFTILDYNYGVGVNYCGAIAYKVLGAGVTTTQAPTWSWSSGATQAASVIATFKSSGGGGGGGGGMLNRFSWMGGIGKPISSMTGGMNG